MSTSKAKRTKPFTLGKTYKTQGGDAVLIIAVSDKHVNYATVQGDDGLWRYNRPDDRGRVTASAFDMSEPLNLVPEPACDRPTTGWWCSRDVGHKGACAARELKEMR